MIIVQLLQQFIIILSSMQYIDIELDDIEYLYNCDKEEILEKLNEIKEIEY